MDDLIETLKALHALFSDSQAQKIKKAVKLGAYPVCELSTAYSCGDYGFYDEKACVFTKHGNIFDERWIDKALGSTSTETGKGTTLEIGLSSALVGQAAGGKFNVAVKVSANWKLNYYLKTVMRLTTLTSPGSVVQALEEAFKTEASEQSTVDIRKLYKKYGPLHVITGVWHGTGFLATGLNKGCEVKLMVQNPNDFGAELATKFTSSVVKSIPEARPLFLKLAKMSKCEVIIEHSSAAQDHGRGDLEENDEYYVELVHDRADALDDDDELLGTGEEEAYIKDEPEGGNIASAGKRLKQSAEESDGSVGMT